MVADWWTLVGYFLKVAIPDLPPVLEVPPVCFNLRGPSLHNNLARCWISNHTKLHQQIGFPILENSGGKPAKEDPVRLFVVYVENFARISGHLRSWGVGKTPPTWISNLCASSGSKHSKAVKTLTHQTFHLIKMLRIAEEEMGNKQQSKPYAVYPTLANTLGHFDHLSRLGG